MTEEGELWEPEEEDPTLERRAPAPLATIERNLDYVQASRDIPTHDPADAGLACMHRPISHNPSYDRRARFWHVA